MELFSAQFSQLGQIDITVIAFALIVSVLWQTRRDDRALDALEDPSKHSA